VLRSLPERELRHERTCDDRDQGYSTVWRGALRFHFTIFRLQHRAAKAMSNDAPLIVLSAIIAGCAVCD
jgi:hypothetical protein